MPALLVGMWANLFHTDIVVLIYLYNAPFYSWHIFMSERVLFYMAKYGT